MDNNFDPVREYFSRTNNNNNEVLSGIGEYVQKMLGQHFTEINLNNLRQSSHSQSQPTFSPNEHVIELHGFVIIQLQLPEDHFHSLIIEANSTNIVLYGLPSGEQKKIKLPCFVRANSAKALYKDELLEIRLPKLQEDEFHQVVIKGV